MCIGMFGWNSMTKNQICFHVLNSMCTSCSSVGKKKQNIKCPQSAKTIWFENCVGARGNIYSKISMLNRLLAHLQHMHTVRAYIKR